MWLLRTLREVQRNVAMVLKLATKEHVTALEVLRNDSYESCHLMRLAAPTNRPLGLER